VQGILKAGGIVLAGLLFLCALIWLIRKLYARSSRKRELEQYARERMRDESLDRKILNASAAMGEREKAYNPYDVDYESGLTGRGKRPGRELFVSLVEKNELSTKKFVLNPANCIRIGSGLRGNDVVVQGEGVAEYQCEIFSHAGKVYVRSCKGGARTVLCRKKQRACVDEKGIRLSSGDTLEMGKVEYGVTLIG